MKDDFLKDFWEPPKDEFKQSLYERLKQQEEAMFPSHVIPAPRLRETPSIRQWRRLVATLLAGVLIGVLAMMLWATVHRADEPTYVQQIEVSATPTLVPEGSLPSSATVDGLPFFSQTWNGSAASTMAMAIGRYDLIYQPSIIQSGLGGIQNDPNVMPFEISNFITNAEGNFREDTYDMTLGMSPNVDVLKQLIVADFPVIVEIGEHNFSSDPIQMFNGDWGGRYTLVVGYDENGLVLYDPYRGFDNGRNFHMSYSEFDRLWREFNRIFMVIHNKSDKAAVQVAIGDLQDADLMLEQVHAQAQAEIDADASDAWAWFNLGEVLSEQGQYESAVEAFNTAFDLKTLPQEVLFYRFSPLKANLEAGNYTEVLQLIGRVSDDKVVMEEFSYFQGLVSLARGNLETAQTQLEQTLAINPYFTPARIALADLMALIEDTGELDSDGDGLSDAEEMELGTNPTNIDTDGDGLSDGVEVNERETNPLNPDTDMDGQADSTDVEPTDPSAS